MHQVATHRRKSASWRRLAAASVGVGLGLFPLAHGATADETPQAPKFSVAGGRYEHTVAVELKAERGETIRYTTDGSIPQKSSRAYGGRPIRISKDTNLTARAFKGNKVGAFKSAGYLIRKGEQPIARMMILSDVHVGDYGADRDRWTSYFDTIGGVLGKPDAILSNGDMINDNGDGRGKDHQMVARIFKENLQRKGMNATKVLMAYGNHDASLADVRAGYPKEWFPDSGDGYYRTEVKGIPVVTVNTENYSAAQGAWLRTQLAQISANPAYRDLPIIVGGHKPVPGTVLDGQQTANPALAQDMAKFPRAVYFSGHSHLNLNDPRAIHQKNFTAVNDSSSSYIEFDHGYQMLDAEGKLAGRFETPTAQGLAVEIYRGRTVINRINLNADLHDIYTGGKWSANWKPPYQSDGTLAGEPWEIKTAGGDAKVVRNFTYTDANRNRRAPRWTSSHPLSAQTGEDGRLALRIEQAKDDELVYHYKVRVTRADNGTEVLTTKVANRFDVVPAADSMDIPVPAKRDGVKYRAEVIAVDAQGNQSQVAVKVLK
ncbi:chitobiase/beta-hexosaminidase C-terminal domain-containing protein [Actinomadura litoris]|uniref:Phosphoesterase n=1 Tax=Actinomadura litoris TaxID=2678616 RepID=A0A7K1KU33_9ACTN|nr:chitobiase/beta-hexosaminidase C-terminal domain-containing protein [Actinomadura litoris]MUN35689.1 phosphoesterase [Actinomadura litoris]